MIPMVNLKKIFVLFFLFFLFFNIKSQAEIVKKVEVKGNERISLETIVIFGDIIIDKDYKVSDINLLIKKLYETSFFSDISVELKNGVLRINVEENSIIKSCYSSNCGVIRRSIWILYYYYISI